MTAFIIVIPGIAVPYVTYAVDESTARADAAMHYGLEALPPWTTVNAEGAPP